MQAKFKNYIERAPKPLLLAYIFLYWIEISGVQLIDGLKLKNLSFYLLLIDFICIVLIKRNEDKNFIKNFYNEFIKEFYRNIRTISKLDGRVFKSENINYFLVLLILLYLIIDFIGVFYSPVPLYALDRYRTIFINMCTALLVFLIIKNRKSFNQLLLTIGFASTFISLFTLYKYFISPDTNLLYTERMSLIKDYNIFATQILIGMMLIAILVKEKLKFNKKIKYIILGADLFVNGTIVMLTSSRRAFLLLFFTVVLLGYYYFKPLLKFRKKIELPYKKVIKISVIIVVCFALVVIGFITFNKNNYGVLTYRYSTLFQREGYRTRLTRYDSTMNILSYYNIGELLIGKGSAYDTYIFSANAGKPIGSDYPHNALLSDILNGGIIKFVSMLAILVIVIGQLVFIRKADFDYFIALFSVWFTILFFNFVSGFGILFDFSFWVFICLNMIIISRFVKKEDSKQY